MVLKTRSCNLFTVPSRSSPREAMPRSNRKTMPAQANSGNSESASRGHSRCFVHCWMRLLPVPSPSTQLLIHKIAFLIDRRDTCLKPVNLDWRHPVCLFGYWLTSLLQLPTYADLQKAWHSIISEPLAPKFLSYQLRVVLPPTPVIYKGKAR